MANRRKQSADDAESIRIRKETEEMLGVERGDAEQRRIIRGRAAGGQRRVAANRLARIRSEREAGSRGPFKKK